MPSVVFIRHADASDAPPSRLGRTPRVEGGQVVDRPGSILAKMARGASIHFVGPHIIRNESKSTYKRTQIMRVMQIMRPRRVLEIRTGAGAQGTICVDFAPYFRAAGECRPCTSRTRMVPHTEIGRVRPRARLADRHQTRKAVILRIGSATTRRDGNAGAGHPRLGTHERRS